MCWKKPQRGLNTAAWTLIESGCTASTESTVCDRDEDVAQPVPPQPWATTPSNLSVGADAATKWSNAAIATMRASTVTPIDARNWQPYKDMATTHKYPRILRANERGFVANYLGTYPDGPAEVPMQCFDPDDLPILTTLAREYVICDNWFASMPGPTWTNRFWVHGASPTKGRFSEDPPDKSKALALTGLGHRFAYANGTIWDRLDAANLWGLGGYDGPSQICEMEHAIVVGPDMVWDPVLFPELGTDVPGTTLKFAPKYVFIEPNYGSQANEIPAHRQCVQAAGHRW